MVEAGLMQACQAALDLQTRILALTVQAVARLLFGNFIEAIIIWYSMVWYSIVQYSMVCCLTYHTDIWYMIWFLNYSNLVSLPEQHRGCRTCRIPVVLVRGGGVEHGNSLGNMRFAFLEGQMSCHHVWG